LPPKNENAGRCPVPDGSERAPLNFRDPLYPNRYFLARSANFRTLPSVETNGWGG